AAGQRKIAVARTVLRKLVAGLPDEVMIGLRVYGHRYPRKPKARSCTDSQLVVPFQRVDKEAFARFVDSIEPKGQTPIGLSLRRVAEDFGDTPGPKIVVLITDGEETCSPDPEDPDYPPRVVEELLAQGLEVKVNIVGFDIEKDEVRAFLSDLAARTGGVFYGADNAAELEKALKDALKAPYEVRDMLGKVIARGTIDGGAIEVPAGIYRVEVAASSPLVMEGVRIEAGRETRLDVNKEGSEIAVDRSIGAPGTPLARETGTTPGSETADAALREAPAGGQAPRRPPSATSPPATSAPAASPSGTAATVARLLEEAERLFEQKKLTTPEGESALSRYRAVLALDPDNEAAKEGIRRIVATYVDWARAAGERGDTRKQVAYLERALTADPRNADLLFIYGGTLMDLERYSEAAEVFERAASLLSDPTEARFFAGMARLNADQPEKALAHFSRVRQTESEYRHQAGYFEAGVLFGLDRYDEAYDVLSATLRAKGDCETAPLDELCTDLWTLTVYVLRMMNREDAIMETVVGVLDLEPASPDL
ncbi:MAG TPA: VWA domain-containing protein, partial [Rhodospirillales bacterium]|nr:VWA domain-containing protein [Rhodospirillales bacterium]